MTIADAFNEITIAQGGTPNYSGTIASAIDALNDALAGSDQPAETTIEGAVRLLGQHIGGGGGGTEYAITCLKDNEPVSSYVYKAIWDEDTGYIKDPDSPALDKAMAGERLFVELDEGYAAQVFDEHSYVFAWVNADDSIFYMTPSAATIAATED